jgi:hypothetical protein
MSKIRRALPELIISIVSLIPSVLGVPSVANIAVQVFQVDFPSWTKTFLTLALRLFGWFLTFEAGYRIAHRWRRGQRSH